VGAVASPSVLSGALVHGEQVRAKVLVAIEEHEVAREDGRGAGSMLGDRNGQGMTPEFFASHVEAGEAEGAEVRDDPFTVRGGRRGGRIPESRAALDVSRRQRPVPEFVAVEGGVRCDPQGGTVPGGEEYPVAGNHG
jgi:hypothetical protein